MDRDRAGSSRTDQAVTLPWLEDAARHLDESLFGPRRIHACLLAGPRLLGKVDLATRKAATLLCLQPVQADENWQACGECRSCRLLAGGAHPDLRTLTFEFKPKPNENELRTELVVDQIRELSAALSLSNILSPCKVALIYPAEALNRVAANALLKTLEEPPGSAVLMLIANEAARLPATVRSRCQTIHVRMPEHQQARNWLIESKGVNAELADAALAAAAGSPLLAAQLFANGELDQYQGVARSLAQVRSNEGAVSEALDVLLKSEPEQVWTWISLIAAQRLRLCFIERGRDQRLAGDSMEPAASPSLGAAAVARLQSLADRNRRLMSTAVKKDLLLRDWLIQWSRLTGT